MIGSVQKIARILNCFTSDEPVLSNSEIAEKLGMNPSTVHHLLLTLCQEGMLMKDSNKKYRLGWKLLEWGNQVMYQRDILNAAMPLIEGLTRSFRGTVHIGMYDQGEVVFVLKVTPKHAMPVPTQIGSRIPAYCCSTGKVLLSFNSFLVQSAISKGLSQRAPNTITCVTRLNEELKEIRTKGYSISNNENELGLYGIAAPIQSYSGKTVAALNMVGPIEYMDRDRGAILQSVIRTAKSISQELGYIEI